MSFLQECVKQVKPRTENYTPPVEKIQNILSEAFGLADIWKRDNHKNFIDKNSFGCYYWTRQDTRKMYNLRY